MILILETGAFGLKIRLVKTWFTLSGKPGVLENVREKVGKTPKFGENACYFVVGEREN